MTLRLELKIIQVLSGLDRRNAASGIHLAKRHGQIARKIALA